MRRLMVIVAVVFAVTMATAQTLNIAVGNVVYRFPAVQTGDMTYTNGTSLTVMGKTFSIADIASMTVDNTEVTDNLVEVSFDGSSARVSIAGNIARYVDVSMDGAYVTLSQSDEVGDSNVGEITYSLSGKSEEGGFCLSGSYKSTVEFNGLILTNPKGAAVDIQNGKRIDISVKKDSENTLVDGLNGTQKACLVVKGHPKFKGKGTLNVYGNTGHAIKAGEYVEIKNCTINVKSAVKDGINCTQYFLMESGLLNISGIGDDGIQVDLEGDVSTGITEGHEDEDTGNAYILGGTINITVTSASVKGIKAAGDVDISGGEVNVEAKGMSSTVLGSVTAK